MPNPPKPYGRQLEEQIQQTEPEFDAKKAGEKVAQFLGFVAFQHKEAIIHDIYVMATRSASPELDGYVLAIARCMEQELAWHCISTAFKRANKSIPEKYYNKFSKSAITDEAANPRKVE